jgi:hypothetical protein
VVVVGDAAVGFVLIVANVGAVACVCTVKTGAIVKGTAVVVVVIVAGVGVGCVTGPVPKRKMSSNLFWEIVFT